MLSFFYRTKPLFRAGIKFAIIVLFWLLMQQLLYGTITAGLDIIVIGIILFAFIIKGEYLDDEEFFAEYLSDALDQMSDEELKELTEATGIEIEKTEGKEGEDS